MERKHFVTSAQTVLTRIITMTTTKQKDQKYKYLIAKLPATFKNQTVTYWSDKKGYGGKQVATVLGGSAMIRVTDEDIDVHKFKLGDILTATFKDRTVELE